MAKKLIRLNLKESLDFHINNLNSNKINLKKTTIRNILYTLREETFPSEDNFLSDIT